MRRARKAPGVRIDLSSLGKGRGVDRVAEYLDGQGVTNYLIDLSGKLRARGRQCAWQRRGAWPSKRPKRMPLPTAPSFEPKVIALRDESVATAGDYRRFFEIGGRHYSHIIDPRTGWPVTHGTVSASAIAAGLHAGGCAGDSAYGHAAGRSHGARQPPAVARHCSSAATGRIPGQRSTDAWPLN